MNRPAVFISCVSPEFRQTRSRVAAILTRLGYTPVIQEIFGTDAGDLRQVLGHKIDACEGLIQIVGQAYGAEPPTVDAKYGRVSYTQFEFIYACEKKKKTWLVFARDACTRDTPLERLDLPNDPAHPDPAGYQAERRALQLTYCDKRRNDGHLYQDAINDTDFDLKVERLRDEFAELRRAFKLWQNKVLNAFAAGFVLLAVIGSSVWWFGLRQHREIKWISGEIKGISEEARHITKEKIRGQLLEAVERTRQVALADAQKIKGWEERERLRQAAEKTYAESVSRIDELAASFAEIEGTERSTQVFDEMTRILAEEGVDQALAYVATQLPGILEKVKARTAATREKNRTELMPLLKSAQLQTQRNHPAEAEHLFREILALERDWGEARSAFAWFLIQRGEVIEPAQGNTELREAVQICQETLALNPREKSPQDWAMTQNALSVALRDLGTRSGGEEGRKLLGDAVAASRGAVGVYTKADLPQGWAMTQNNLGAALWDLGWRSSGEEGRKLLGEAVAAYRGALEVYTKADLPQGWAMTQNNLGNALRDLGWHSGGEERRKLFGEAVAAYRSALEVYTKAGRPSEWAMTQNNLGLALNDLGTLSGGEEDRKLFGDAVAAFRSALEVYTKAGRPQDWALTQTNLGIALRDLGTRIGGEEGRKLLGDAVAAYRGALEVYTKADLPEGWARTQNNLSLALWDLGSQLEGEERLKRLREAVESLRNAVSYQPDDQSRYQLASRLGGLAFLLILNNQFAEAQTRCEEAQRLANDIGDGIQKTDRDNLIFIRRNLAHALLFQGYHDEALAIYRENWEKPLRGKTFGEITLEDFAAFDKAGLTHSDLSRMKQALENLESNASSP
jgi:tetratricopeptide (TPR) repeat protein